MTKSSTPKIPSKNVPLPSILPPNATPNVIFTNTPTNFQEFILGVIIPKALKNTPNIDLASAIYELLNISVEIHFEMPNTIFANMGNKGLVVGDLFLSEFPIFYAQNPNPSIKLEHIIQQKVGGQTIINFEIFENMFNFLFSTNTDKILLSQKLEASHLLKQRVYQDFIHKIQQRLIPFYTKFPMMKKIYDNSYVTIIIIGLYLLNLSQKCLGTFKDAVFSTLPKKLDRTQTVYVEKTAIYQILQTIKPSIKESVDLKDVDTYRDLQAIYDCSLAFLPFHEITQKFSSVKTRLEKTDFVNQAIQDLMQKNVFEQYLEILNPKHQNPIPVASLKGIQMRTALGILETKNNLDTINIDDITITKNLLLLEILCIDAFVQDQDFYRKTHKDQGILNFLQQVPRLKNIKLQDRKDFFSAIFKNQVQTWNYHAWNTDGSIRSAKNLILKPIGPSPARANMQLSYFACVLDSLLASDFESMKQEFDMEFGNNNCYDIYKTLRSSVFVTSSYFDDESYEYFKDANPKLPKDFPLQAIYLFLVFCQYRIKSFAMNHAVLLEKSDVLEQPIYDPIKGAARSARYDMYISPILRSTLAVASMFVLGKFIQKPKKQKVIEKK